MSPHNASTAVVKTPTTPRHRHFALHTYEQQEVPFDRHNTTRMENEKKKTLGGNVHRMWHALYRWTSALSYTDEERYHIQMWR